MITSIKLNNHKKCIVWINEKNKVPITSVGRIMNKSIPSRMKKSTGIEQIALELSLPKNHSNYALVGFEYKSNNTNQNLTNITVLTSNEKVYYSSQTLSDSHDKVLIGISEEYGQSVLESAVETLNDIGGFPAGEITFNVGAHAECGSSKVGYYQVKIYSRNLK